MPSPKAPSTSLSHLSRLVPVVLGEAALLALGAFAYWGWRLLQQPHNGMDFLAYYTAARMVDSSHGGQLYDLALQHQFQAAILGIPLATLGKPLEFINPPPTVLFFAPLGYLSYDAAYYSWALASVLMIVACACVLPRLYGLAGRNAWLASALGLAFYPGFITVVRGQLDALMLVSLTLCLAAWKSNRPFWAGLALGLGLVKPQLLAVIVVYWLVTKSWRALAGLALAAAFLVAASALLLGPQVWERFLLFNLPGGGLATTPYAASAALIYSVYGLAANLHLPPAFGWLLALLLLGGFALVVWHRRPHPGVGLAAALALGIAISPHRGAQDLLLMLLVGIALASYLLRRPQALGWGLLAAAYLALQACLFFEPPVVFALLLPAAYLLWCDYRYFGAGKDPTPHVPEAAPQPEQQFDAGPEVALGVALGNPN